MQKCSALFLLAFLMLIFGRSGAGMAQQTAPAGDEELRRSQERVKRLHQDISLINLLNGLNLNREQLTKLLSLAQEARQVREQLLSREYRASLQQAETSFAALRDEVGKGAPARGEVPAQAAKMNHRLKEFREQNHQEVAQTLQSLEGRIRQVLTPEQLQVVDKFTPCLIPPADMRDPVRAGQAASQEGMMKRLRQLRALPEDRWQAHRDRIAQGVVDKISQKVKPLTEAEKQQEKARLLALAERIRRLPEVDFEMEKDKLVEELIPRARLKELQAALAAKDPRSGSASRLSRYFLNDRIIPILEERLAKGRVAGLK